MSIFKNRYIWVIVTVLFLLGFGVSATLYGPEPLVLHAPTVPIPHTYFGLHIHHAASGTVWPEADFGSWRLWDTRTQWTALEPQKGKWNFALLDKLVALGEEHHEDIMLTLGQSPAWASSHPTEKSASGELGAAAPPANVDDWREYVRTVATRYKGRIHAYEVWNEPNLKEFYSGSVEQLVELTNTAAAELKKVDPAIRVVTPSGTSDYGVGWLTEFLQAGGAKNADVIGYHFYVTPKDPEASLDLITRVQEAMRASGAGSKPLWNTEFGYFVTNKTPQHRPDQKRVLSEDEASAILARTLILNWVAGVQRVFWYAFDNGYMGMTEPDGKTVKKNAHAYTVVQGWLEGARMGVCADHSGAIWTCNLTLKNGKRAQVGWSPRGPTQWHIQPGFRAHSVTDVQGVRRPFKGQIIDVGTSPLLLEGD